MFHVRFAALLPLLFVSTVALALPQESDFRAVDNIPQPDPFATGVVGCSLPDGRYLLWDGNTVFLQQSVGSGVFTPIATGYAGDPGFAVLSPGGDFVLLGQGFGNGATANVYPFDFDNPADFQSGDEIVVPNHFAAAFLNSSLVAFDRGDFGSPAEIIVLDLFPTMRSGAPRVVTVLRAPASSAPRDTIITKPPSSFSASIAVNGTTFYVADSGNGQYKSFAVADIVNAFNTSGTVAWASGTDIGTAFQYPLGGVSGFTASGNLVIAGFGSIVEVEPGTGNVLTSFDPAGTGPFYGIVYNAVTEDFIAIEFPPTFGDPLTYYATGAGVASLPASNEWTLTLLGVAVLLTAICLTFNRKTTA
jgi:hypothetical protein